MRIAGGRRPGRSHHRSGTPCQDAYSTFDQPGQGRAAAALADGLGGAGFGGIGSQVAVHSAIASLANDASWDAASLERAFAAAHAALAKEAARLDVQLASLATTLQLATLEGGNVSAAMVGDGAIVRVHRSDPRDGAPSAASDPTMQGPAVSLLLAPPPSEYANEVEPLTAPEWRRSLRVATGAGDSVLLFSDGLTRLLLARDRSGWFPFGPFFSAFLPHLHGPVFDPWLVERFLARPEVEASWDDDKCLVVVAHGTP